MFEVSSPPGRAVAGATDRERSAAVCRRSPLHRACATTVVATIALASTTAHAALYFGEDLNTAPDPRTTPLTATPLSSSAEADFLARLTGTRTETFESLGGRSGPITLTFPGTSGDFGATLTGGGGSVRTQPVGTASEGRYSVPAATSTNYWEVAASACGPTGCGSNGFAINFDRDVAAFGFYGIDIGDFEGQLSLAFVRSDGSLVSGGWFTVPHSFGFDGNALFLGFIADAPAQVFRSVQFRTSDVAGDVFAFDRFTAATYCQVDTAVGCTPGDGGGPAPVPAPPTLPLIGAALAALLATRRRPA